MIEYVPDEAPPPADKPVPLARRRYGAVVMVVLAFAVLLIARALTSGGRDTPVARPTTAHTDQRLQNMTVVLNSSTGRIIAALCAGQQSLPVLGAEGQWLPSGDDLPVAHDTGGTLAGNEKLTPCASDASSCPEADDGLNACASTSAVPAGAARAVDRWFPTARLAEARTETVRENGRLWYRNLLYSLGSGDTMRVEVVLDHEDPPSSDETVTAAGRFTRAVARHGRYDVLVTTAGPSGSPSTMSAQMSLAQDAALLAG